MDEETLEKLAIEEILKETKRGAERAKEFGALGWQKPPVPTTNKRFLSNMILSSVNDSNRKKRRHSEEPDSPKGDNSSDKTKTEKNGRDHSRHGSEKGKHKKKKKRHDYSEENRHKNKHKHSSRKHKSGHKHKKHRHKHKEKVKE